MAADVHLRRAVATAAARHDLARRLPPKARLRVEACAAELLREATRRADDDVNPQERRAERGRSTGLGTSELQVRAKHERR